MTDNSDQIIGPFRKVSILGQGGMGVVYEAEHLESGQKVALKTVRLPHASMLQNLRREIITLAQLKHPGIIKIVEEGVHQGVPWYAMELLRGVNLCEYCGQDSLKGQETGIVTEQFDNDTAQMTNEAHQIEPKWWTMTVSRTSSLTTQEGDQTEISQDCPVEMSRPDEHEEISASKRHLSERELRTILTLIRRVCAPISYLHGEGIIHRDLKPDNILIRSNGTPVIVDFGLLSTFGGEIHREFLQVGAFSAGSANYIAPEQIRGELVDARADIYSLGCILYELLTGYPPFLRNSPSRTLVAHIRAQLTPPSELIHGIPEQVNELVLQLLARNPRHRIGYADHVARILEQLGAENGQSMTDCKPRTYLYRPGFVGRERQLSMIRKNLVLLEKSQGSVILLGGESGVGKTRLVIEVAREAQFRNFYVLTGECKEKNNQPLIVMRKPLKAIADWCREHGRGETDRVLGSKGTVLALYETALADLPGQDAYQPAAPLPPNQAKYRLFNYLVQVLTALARDNPIVMIFDDLQWADKFSLEFLEFIV